MPERLLIAVLLLVCAPAQAHLLKVFAYAEGRQILGSAYFTGGDPASGARISILDSADRELAVLTPDDQGQFSYETETGGEYRIVADTGDGHVARWNLAAGEPDPARPPQQVAEPSRAQAPAGQPERAELQALIETAVARQVGPLRAELQQHAARARLADIVGGIGLIFGLAGLALWWRNRRPPGAG